MSQLASMSEQEQQFINALEQAIETQSFERLILSQYKGELEHLEKMTFSYHFTTKSRDDELSISL